MDLTSHSELIVKVVNVKDPLQVTLLTGHKKPVRETTWSPDGSLLVSSAIQNLLAPNTDVYKLV